MKSQFTAVYEKQGEWYIGYVEEITGVNTQGRTLIEVKKNLKDALKMVLSANRAIARKDINKKRVKVIEEPISVAI